MSTPAMVTSSVVAPSTTTSSPSSSSASSWTTLMIFVVIKVVHLLETRLVRVALTGRHSALLAALVAILAVVSVRLFAVAVVGTRMAGNKMETGGIRDTSTNRRAYGRPNFSHLPIASHAVVLGDVSVRPRVWRRSESQTHSRQIGVHEVVHHLVQLLQSPLLVRLLQLGLFHALPAMKIIAFNPSPATMVNQCSSLAILTGTFRVAPSCD